MIAMAKRIDAAWPGHTLGMFGVMLFCCLTGLGQTATPTPTPGPEDAVVKISTNLVQIDVSVTDRKGNVVRDLKPEDFEIYENGKKQPVSAFSFISSARERTEEAAAGQCCRAGPAHHAPPRPGAADGRSGRR